MVIETVTLRLPDVLYHRLANNARATRRSLEEVALYALQVGSPPGWEDASLAEMDRLDDEALWRIYRQQMSATELRRYDDLLSKNEQGGLDNPERYAGAGSRFRFHSFHANAACFLLVGWHLP